MRNLALGILLGGIVAASAACGGDDPEIIDVPGDALLACNPTKQTGCAAGEKCTWVVDLDSPRRGHVDCVPGGEIPNDGECTTARAGVNEGADACATGTLCVRGRCKPICDPQLVEGSALGACTANYSCSRYEGYFDSGGAAGAGVCEPACDPLTQRLKVGTTNVDACGSLTPAAPSATCIRGPGYRTFACAPTELMFYGKTDRKPPELSPSGDPYPNGCAPGFLPFYFEDVSGSMKTLCSGMCAPLKVDATIAAMTGHADDNKGDPLALGKLPTQATPMPGNATCTPGKKGADDITAPRGQDCRFLWYPLAVSNSGVPVQTLYNDTLGFCFAYEKFLSIMPPGGGPRLPEKSCAELPETAPDSDPFRSAKDNGCYPLSQSAPVRRNPRKVVNYRLANGDGAALRHVFE
jgi:hypothetical protein